MNKFSKLITFISLLSILVGTFSNVQPAVSKSAAKEDKSKRVPDVIILSLKENVTLEDDAGGNANHKFKTNSTELDQVLASLGVQFVKPLFPRGQVKKDASNPELERIYQVKLKKNTDIDAVLAALLTVADVDYAEPDFYIDTTQDPDPTGTPTPGVVNDPRYPEQWALPAIGAPQAWGEMPADAPNVTVAVIDSGICASHPDLEGRILEGWDFVQNDSTPQDDFGHGCSVSGIIAANTNNGVGIAGVAPNAQIMPLRVLDSVGAGSYSNVASAIVYAADHDAQVINLSLGGASSSTTLENAVNYAIFKSVIVVAAAGNNGTEGALYPAAYPDVIVVGSVDSNLQHSSFSNYGSQIDIWAPGRDILTTKRDGSYGLVSGTSFAAPYVAGAEAIKIAQGYELTLGGVIVNVGDESVVEAPTMTTAPNFTATPTPTITFTPSSPDFSDLVEYTVPYLGMIFSYPSTWTLQPLPYMEAGFRISSPNILVDSLGRPSSGGYINAAVSLSSDAEWEKFILSNLGESVDILGYRGIKLSGIESETYQYIEWHFFAYNHHNIFRFVSSINDFDSLLPIATEVIANARLTGVYEPEPVPPSFEQLNSQTWNNPAILQAFLFGPGKIINDYNAGSHTGALDYGLDICEGAGCVSSSYNDIVYAPTNIKLVHSDNGYNMPPTSKDYHFFEVTSDLGGKLCLAMGHFSITIPSFTKGKTMPRQAQIGRIIRYTPSIDHIHMNLYSVPADQGCEVVANRVAVPFDGTRTDLRGQKLDGVDYHIGTSYVGNAVTSTLHGACALASSLDIDSQGLDYELTSMGGTGCDGEGLPPLPTEPPPSSDTIDGLKLISVSAPTVQKGETFPVSITYEVVSGQLLESSSSGQHLFGSDPTYGAWPVQSIPGTINPGQQVTFSFNLTAPQQTGTFESKWQIKIGGVLKGPQAVVRFAVQDTSSPPTSSGPWNSQAWQNKYLAGYPNWEGQWTWSNNYPYVSFNWGTGAPFGWGGNEFSMRLWKTIHFPGGYYSFHASHDDGVKVYLDNTVILDAWWDGSGGHDIGKNIPAGDHEVKVEYYENTGDANVTVHWYGPGFPEPDTNPPDGRITSPANHSATASFPLTITADASDDVSGVNRVEFYANYCDGSCGWRLISTDFSLPYSAAWDWSALTDQHVQLTTHMIDNTGKVRNDPGGYIEVDLDRMKPTVSITSPLDGALLNGDPITITASASDSLSGVRRLQFFAGYVESAGAGAQTALEIPPPVVLGDTGELSAAGVSAQGWHEIGWDENGSDGWSLNWTPSAVPNQSNVSIFIYAYDHAGNHQETIVSHLTIFRQEPVDILYNGGFEIGVTSPALWSPDAWQMPSSTFTWDTTQVHSGNKSIKISNNITNDARWVQTVYVQPNSDYRLSGWIMTDNVAHSSDQVDAGANLSILNNTLNYTTPLFSNNSWTYVSRTFNTGSNTTVNVVARLGMYSGTTTGTAWFDDLKLELLSTPVCYTMSTSVSPTGSGGISRNPAPNCNNGTQYVHGTVVQVTASPVAEASFSNWGGACSGTNTCYVVMDAAKSVSATFTSTYPLTVSKAGTGSGTVASNPIGINCGADCSENYNSNTSVTLSAAPANGSTFTGWNGACTGTGSCVVSMTAAKSVTATFALGTYSLTVSKTGTGSGTVTSSPAGINCGSDCSEAYSYNTSVTLTAVPSSAGSVFTGWSGGSCSGAGTCIVTMAVARSVTANFAALPTVSMNSTTANLTNISSIPVTITFSSSVTGFMASDITTSNGSVSNFAGSGTSYTFNLLPSANGLVTVNIPAGAAQDTFGNNNLASSQFSRTYDTIPPVTSITSHPASLDNDSTPTFAFSGDDGAGSGAGSYLCKMDAGDYVVCATPFTSPELSDGPHTFQVKAIDRASNEDTTSESYTWILDLIRPTITSIDLVGADTPNLASIDFDVTFSEPVTDIGARDFKLTNTLLTDASITAVIPVSDREYTVTVNTGTGDGTIRLDIPATAIIEDFAGNTVTVPYTGGETYTVQKGAAPTVPVLTAPAANALVTTTPTLDWGNSSEMMALTVNPWSYEVNVTSLNGYDHTFNTASGLTNSSLVDWSVAPLSPNTTYSWKVRAYNGTNQYSAWSLTRTFRTKLDVPILISPADAAAPALLNNRPTFQWGVVSGATGYTIQISKLGATASTTTLTSTTYTPTVDLLPNTTYIWEVKANGLNAGDYSTSFTFTTSANPPKSPVLSSPASDALVDGSVEQKLKWNPVAAVNTTSALTTYPPAASFQVEYALNGAFTDSTVAVVNGNTLVETQLALPANTLLPNRTYYWRVRSWSEANAAGNYSVWSLPRTFRTNMPVSKLSSPMLVSPTNGITLDNKRPTFMWNEVSGATSYTLQILKGTAVVKTATITVPLHNYVQITDLLPNTVYTWQVKANGRVSSDYSTPFTFTTSLNAPKVPVLSAPAANAPMDSAATIRLDWNPVLAVNTTSPSTTYPAAANYDVEYATNSQFIGSTLVNVVEDQYDLPNLLPAHTTFYWRVRSINATGQASAWSVAQIFKTRVATTVLNVPLNGASLNNKRPVFEWDAVEGATTYTLQIFKKNTTTNLFTVLVHTGIIPAPRYTYTPTIDLLPSTEYAWQVKANHTVYPGAYSARSTFTTSVNPPKMPVQSLPNTGTSIVNTADATLTWLPPLVVVNANPALAYPAAVSYDVQVSTNSAFVNINENNNVELLNVSNLNTTLSAVLATGTVPDNIIRPGRTYYWRVRSVSVDGNYSSWSTARTILVKFTTPLLTSVTDSLTIGKPTFTWDSNGNGLWTSYTITVVNATTNAVVKTYTVPAPLTTYTIPATLPRLPAGTYKWKVKINGLYTATESALSSSFTVAP